MIKKIILICLIFIIGGISGYFIFLALNPDFKSLTSQEMYQQIISQRKFAIAKAQKIGDYNCCINPPCTMCYDDANQWNYNQAGKCFCDELIAKGEEPCPQCKKGLDCSAGSIHSTDSSYCDIKLN